MVAFWPWKSNHNSPESFEKALSGLTEKISKSSTRLEVLRQRSRRVAGLWTLYSLFIYLLCTVILTLIVGFRNWGLGEYAVVIGGPFVLYLVRLALTYYYQYRTSAVQSQLDNLQSQRNTTIKKLKAATKYDTTQELLNKYGGTPTPKQKSSGDPHRNTSPKQADPNASRKLRTGFAPPPTANIPKRDSDSPAQSPSQRTPLLQNQQPASPSRDRRFPEPTAEFAPNAFPSAPQYAPVSEGPRWYDKFMDLLMGEDETLPGKRLALICSNCRLVNGLAPPGKQRPEDMGKWRCAACGTMNGEDTEMEKIIASIHEETPIGKTKSELQAGKMQESEKDVNSKSENKSEGEESDVTQYSTDEELGRNTEQKPEISAPKENTRRRSARAKANSNS